jgi:hypothetical protein
LEFFGDQFIYGPIGVVLWKKFGFGFNWEIFVVIFPLLLFLWKLFFEAIKLVVRKKVGVRGVGKNGKIKVQSTPVISTTQYKHQIF